MSTIFVAGAGGYIGSVLIEALLDAGRRAEDRRARRFCPARRHWKSFAHVRGGRRFTKLS